MSAGLDNVNSESRLLNVFSRPWVAILACSILVMLNAWEWRNYFVDDAFIGFRCIENFLAGHGFVFNTGDRVESVTNIGWLAAITPLALIWKTHLAGKIAGVISLLAAVFLVCLLGARIDRAMQVEGRASLLGFMVPLLVFSEPALQYFSLSGMETAFLVCVISASALLAEKSNGLIYASLLTGLAYSIRPECLIFFPLVLLLTGLSGQSNFNRGRRGILIAVCVWASVILMITAARIAYFGDMLPHTFYAKPASILAVIVRAYKLVTGERVNAAFPFTCFFALPFLAYGALHLQKKAPATSIVLAAASVLGFVFAVYSPEDWTDMPRYFAPYMPFAMFLLFAGLQSLVNNSSMAGKSRCRIFMAASFLILIVFFRIEQIKLLGKNAREHYPGYVLTSETLLPAVSDMTGLVAKDDWVATRRIGLLGYAGGFRVFDYVFGLPDREVVRARTKNGKRYFEDPGDAGLKDLWLRRKPRFLLEDRSRLLKSGSVVNGKIDLLIHGCRYLETRSYQLGKNEDWVLLEMVN